MGHVICSRTNTVINWALPAMAAQEEWKEGMWSICVFLGQTAKLGLMDNMNSIGKEKEDRIF